MGRGIGTLLLRSLAGCLAIAGLPAVSAERASVVMFHGQIRESTCSLQTDGVVRSYPVQGEGRSSEPVYMYFSGCSGASVPAALLVQGAVASRRYGLWGVGAGEGHGIELRVTYGGRTRRVTPTENAFLLPPPAVGSQSVLPRLRIMSALAPGTRGGVRAALLFSMVYG